MRKLASIRQIREIIPIKDADKIELVKIDGWQCVAKKGEFQVNDLAVYFEIDSFLPIEERYEFLRKSSYRKIEDKEGFKIKTVKLRGQLSQGLALPITEFKDILDINTVNIGDDVTEVLNISKYEPPIPVHMSGKIKGAFPGFIHKTDQERIQNLWHEYKDLYQDLTFECSIKLDGTSFTCYYFDGAIGVCSRSLELYETDENLYWKIFRQANLATKLKELDLNIAIQGEICGPKIQNNAEQLSFAQVFIFDIWDINQGRYLTTSEKQPLLEILTKENDYIHPIPIIDTIQVFKKFNTLEELLAFAEGPSLQSKNREGLVFKAVDLIQENTIVSFKVISNKYLLAEK